ncbi:hypothetical protein [Streptomyces sp. NPDC059786]|uniref:hypothetical protein n=1 Tax=Streptomyces sp. NPDC059786 TaxID=3346946 RepID=UPI00364C2567
MTTDLTEHARAFLTRTPLEEILTATAKVTAIDRRYLSITLGGETLSMPVVAERIGKLRTQPVSDWSDDEVRLVCAFFAMGRAHIRAEQVGITADLTAVDAQLRDMHRGYRARLAEFGEEPQQATDDLLTWEIADQLPVMRATVDQHFMRVLEIDGRSWHRRELLLPRATLTFTQLAPDLAKALAERHPRIAKSHGDSLDTYLRQLTLAELDQHETPMALIELVMAHAAEDPRHPSDHATLMCPRGTNLDRPGLLGKEDFGIFVAFHRRFVPDPEAGVGHYSAIRKAMYAHHAAKKARVAKKVYTQNGQYTAAGLADDLGAKGIFFNENAHHRGHVVAGVTAALRSLMDITVNGGEGRHDVRGLTDWRISRASTAESAHYTLDEYPSFYAYGNWLKTMVETALGAGAVLPKMIGEWR